MLHYQTRGGGDSSRVLENSESPVGFIVQMFVSEQQSIFYTFHSVINGQPSTAIPFAPEPHSFFLKETKQIGRNIPANIPVGMGLLPEVGPCPEPKDQWDLQFLDHIFAEDEAETQNSIWMTIFLRIPKG